MEFLFVLLIPGCVLLVSGQNTNPTCSSYSVLHSFPETTAVGVLVTLACTDVDPPPNGTLSYNIKSGNDLGKFSINSANGAISLASTIDFDDSVTPHTHTLTVEVSDGGSPSLTATADVVVTLRVTGVNDNTPTFDQATYTTTLAENIGFNDLVYAPTGNDSDVIDDALNLQPFTCSIVSSPPDSSYFVINPVSCEVRYVQGFDYETATSHTITLEITDTEVTGHTPSKTGQATLTVTVTDVNDNSPSCSASSYAATVEENTAAGGASLITITCIDTDTGASGSVTYSVISGNDDGFFSITASGEIKLANTFDYEDFGLLARSFQLTIQATDAGTPSLSSTIQVNIIFQGINDNDPYFTGTPYTTTLSESLALDGFVYEASWSDDDMLDENFNFQTVVCSVVGGDVNMVHCVATASLTCRCTLIQKMDYETATSHSIVLQIDDVGYTTVRTAQETISITVTDSNDAKPSCSASSYVATVTEDTAAGGTALITITCTDADTGAAGTVAYSFTSGNDDGYFSITTTGNNGEIKLANAFDYDDFGLPARSFQLTVQASDGGTPTLSSIITVDIIFQGINDNDPYFNGLPYSTTLPESLAIDGFVFEASWSDDDILDDALDLQNVLCSVVGGDISMFHCVATASLTCRCTLIQKMDYETATSHSIVLQIDDVGYTTVRTAQETISITVTDSNDETPSCSATSYVATVTEDTAAGGTALITITCTDADTGAAGTVAYSFTSGNDDGYFSITTTGNNGEIKLANTFDYDDFGLPARSFQLTVQASDGGTPALSSIMTVDIIFQGINDNDPYFNGLPYSTTLPESLAIDGFVFEASWSDDDILDDVLNLQNVLCSVVGGDISMFHCVATASLTCRCTLIQMMDYETSTSQSIVLQIDDVGYATVRTAQANISITVSDVNDEAPICTPDYDLQTFPEDTAINTALVNLSAVCTDADTEPASLTYSITSGNGVSGCEIGINAASGIISLTNSLDYETKTICELTIDVQDGGTPALTGTATAIINISPINENAPLFTGTPYTVDVLENTTIGDVLFQVSATDGDSGNDGVMKFKLTSHTSVFSIEPTSGIMRLMSTLDTETLNSYSVSVEVTDQSSTTQLTATTTLVVNVIDVNEFSPQCTDVVYVSLSPPITVNDLIHTLDCADNDTGVNGQITYGVVSGNTNSDFNLAANGEIRVANLLSVFLYNIQIQVSDQASSPLSSMVYITIPVVADPIFTSLPYSMNITEATSIGTLVYTVTGNTTTATKTFSIVSGNDENKFSLNKYTGSLYLLNTLDRETTSTYLLTIRITDSISGAFSDSTLTLTVTDANDNPPLFQNDFYNISIVENVAPSTELIDIAATDIDDGVNKDLTYSITSGDTSGVFNINAVGKLILNSALDAETTSLYILVVEVMDNGIPPLNGTTTIYITISDIDEYQTEFLSTAAGGVYTHSISEDTAIGSKVFNVSARDLDANTVITYSITAGNDGSFLINQESGDILLSKLLDRETVGAFSLTIQADNGLGDTSTATLNIQVTDVNDNQPQFTLPTASYTVDENEALGAMVTTITCNDIDDGVNKGLILTIVGGNTGTAFRLDGAILEVNSALDYETTPHYILVIEAKDQGAPQRSASMSVIVDVNPVYPIPKHVSGSDTISVLENTAVGTVVYDDDATALGAIEGTAGSPGDIKYTIQSGNGDGKFFIDPHSGEITVVASLDRDTTSSYSLLVKAENRNDASKTDFLVLTVNLGDINDITPAFVSNAYIFMIDENKSIGNTVGTVSALDGDDGVNGDVSYSITSGENMAHFDISAATGEITLNAALNAASQSIYFLTISAVDGGTPGLTGTCQVKITVNDVNDQVPSFSALSYNLSLTEVALVGSTVFQFRASDGDLGPNSILTYNIISGNNDLRYTLEPLTGDLLIAGILDRETTDNYILTVEVTDSGIPINTGTTTLSIIIVDANDNDPVITSGGGSFTLPRTSAQGTNVDTIAATDADINNNGVVEYYIASGNQDSIFYIDSSSGIITTANSLASAGNTYDLVIHAVDKGTTRNTASVTVQVTVDPPSTTVPSDYTGNVSEDAVIGTPIVTVAPDPVHAPGATINFSILNGDANNDFTINSVTGVINTAKLLDHYVKSNYYLTIDIKDQGDPTKKYNKAVLITVTDVNNNSPIFTVSSLTVSVVENSPTGLSIALATATDNDSGAFGTITYEIDPTDTVATSLVAVDNTGTITLISSPDYEIRTFFSLFLYAKDGGSPSLSSSAAITVNIIDVNDVDPSAAINSPSSYFSLECPTNANTNEVITTLTPQDFGLVTTATDTVQYITKNSQGVFDFNSASGDFYVRDSQYLYDQAQYIMWVVMRVQSDSGNATGTSAMIRVDSLTPNYHLVVLKHSVTGTVLESQKNALRASLQPLFPSHRVGIWKINSVSAARRRRLLAAESESIVYVCDTAADTIDGISNDKTCLSQSDIIQVLSESDGTPSTALNTAAFTSFPVTDVEPYVYTDTSSTQNWAQTTVGIAVIATIASAIVLLAIILVLYFLCTRDRKYNVNKEMDEDFKNNNDEKPIMKPTKARKMDPVVQESGMPVFAGLSQPTSSISTESDSSLNSVSSRKPKKDKHTVVSSIMNGDVQNTNATTSIPPALFQDGKYMKEYPRTDYSRDDTITPRQIIIESQ